MFKNQNIHNDIKQKKQETLIFISLYQIDNPFVQKMQLQPLKISSLKSYQERFSRNNTQSASFDSILQEESSDTKLMLIENLIFNNKTKCIKISKQAERIENFFTSIEQKIIFLRNNSSRLLLNQK